MPPNSWPKWARKRHAKDFTSFDVIEDELKKKTHHGSQQIRRALKKAKTFDEQKLLRRAKNSDGDEGKTTQQIEAVRKMDIDDLSKRCAEAVRRRVEQTVREAFADDGSASAEAKTTTATKAVDLNHAVRADDVLRNVCDEAASALAMNDVDGESEDVAAARRLLRAQATRTEIEALKERLLTIAERMNRAVVGKQKREEWAKEKAEREAKRAVEKAKAEEKAKRRAAGEEVSSSEEDEPNDSKSDESDESDSDSESNAVDEEGYVSLSEETMAELRAAKAAAKASKKSKKSKSSRADDDVDNLDLEPKKKKVKKRMGQRMRRQIAEAKFGANAAHLIAEREKAEAERRAKEEEERNMHPSWQAKRKQAPIIIPGAGKKVKFDEGGGMKRPATSGKPPVKKHAVAPTKKAEPEKPLHPSWQAKLKADEQAWGGGGVKPSGKKVVFD